MKAGNATLSSRGTPRDLPSPARATRDSSQARNDRPAAFNLFSIHHSAFGISPMRIVIAPDKFKGCLTAPQVCDAIARGVRQARPDAEIDLCPMADGGEGTVAALVAATGGRFETRRVTGPLPEMKVDATFG